MNILLLEVKNVFIPRGRQLGTRKRPNYISLSIAFQKRTSRWLTLVLMVMNCDFDAVGDKFMHWHFNLQGLSLVGRVT